MMWVAVLLALLRIVQATGEPDVEYTGSGESAAKKEWAIGPRTDIQLGGLARGLVRCFM